MNFEKTHLTAYAEKIFIYFLLLQPVLDVLAYINVPLSSILRGAAIFAGIAYILMLPVAKTKKTVLIYLTLLIFFLLAHLLTNFMLKEHFVLSLELMYSIKTVFFIVMLLVYSFVTKSLSKQTNWQHIIQSAVVINMTFIAVIMLLSTLTGTGHKSYGALAKAGHSGWFFSANELSVILGMGYAIVILYMMEKTTRWPYMLPIIALIIWSMLTAGTKVSFGSVLIVLSVSILTFVIKAFRHKKHWLRAACLSVILATTIILTPNSPIGHNLNLDFGSSHDSSSTIEQTEQEGQAAKRILSGRKDFLNEMQTQYKEAPVPQKLLGMGYGGNYSDGPKLIEMDFFDWYFHYGLVGFLLFVSPLLLIGYRIIVNLFRHHLDTLDITLVLVSVSVCLGLGSAFVAGHVLSSPAASIYLALVLGYLHTLAEKKEPV